MRIFRKLVLAANCGSMPCQSKNVQHKDRRQGEHVEIFQCIVSPICNVCKCQVMTLYVPFFLSYNLEYSRNLQFPNALPLLYMPPEPEMVGALVKGSATRRVASNLLA